MKILLFALALLVSLDAHALTRDEAVSLSKSRIEGLLPHFADLAYNCFEFDKECQIETNSQMATLKWIATEASKVTPHVSYDSGNDKFLIDGAVRVAKTGSRWTSPVVFNTDLLAVEKSPRNFEALGFYEVLGILVHEFGHHQDFYLRTAGLAPLQHHELDLIAVRVVTYLKDRSRRIQIGPAEVPGMNPDHAITVYQIDREWYNGIRNRWSLIFVDGLAETKEISLGLVRGLRCPIKTEDGHVVFKGNPYYAAFRQVQSTKFHVSENAVEVEQAVGSASVLCIDETMGRFDVFDGYTNGLLRLRFQKNAQGLYTVDTQTSNFAATPPPGGEE